MNIWKSIYYTGVWSPAAREFDTIMTTGYGTSYNSYLIKGAKTILIDTVPEKYAAEFLDRLAAITAVETIDAVVISHAKPGHTGALGAIIDRNPNVCVYAAKESVGMIEAILNRKIHSHMVTAGERLSVGEGITMQFLKASGAYWPGGLFTYFVEERTVFSGDLFASHYCEPYVMDACVKDVQTLRNERERYYGQMLKQFRYAVTADLNTLLTCPVRMICPGHGPVWREYVQETIERYREWVMTPELETYVAICYVSAYGYTRTMAEYFTKMFRRMGMPVHLYHVPDYDRDYLVSELEEAGGILLGSPTIHGDAASDIWELTGRVNALHTNGKPAGMFGSYGWSGEACKFLGERLDALKYNVIGKGTTCVMKPSGEDFKKMDAFSRKFIFAMNQEGRQYD